MEIPTDILFEIWKMSSLLGKRSLALISKELSQRDKVKKFTEQIKSEIYEPQPGDLICFEVISRKLSGCDTYCTFLYDELIGRSSYFPSAGISSVYCYSDKQRLAIRNWFRSKKVYHIQEIPATRLKSYPMRIYFLMNDETHSGNILRWLYLYGKLKSIGEI